MPIKMLALDLDGTLLRDDSSLSEYTLAQLKRCQGLGVKVVIATARSRRAAERFVGWIGADGLILSGGATAQAGDETVASALMPADVADRLIARCLQIPAIRYLHLAGEASYLTNDPSAAGDPDSSRYRYSDFSCLPGQRASKITLITGDRDAVRCLGEEFDMLSVTSYTGEDMHAFSDRQAVKEVALKEIARHFGIAMGEVAAFGNDVNDIGMIRVSGVGVAVGNAVEGLKAVADEVCGGNNEDGVGRWIEARMFCSPAGGF